MLGACHARRRAGGVLATIDDVGDWTPAALDELARASMLQVDRGVRGRDAAASDWGRVVRGTPAAVVRPRSVTDVGAIVRFASERGLTLTARATGAGTGGQSVADGSVTVDVTGLDAVHVDRERGVVTCGPGASWRSVLRAALEHAVHPFVMPMHLDLSVGGVVSVGGFGAIGHRFGVAASHVATLDVVTGDGAIIGCDGSTNADLFDAVRAGLGRCGVITGMTLRLRPAPARVRVVRWQSSSAEAWMDDLLTLASSSGPDAPSVVHIEGFCRTEGDDVVFELQAGVEHGADEPPPELLLSDPSAEQLADEDRPAIAFATRFEPRFEEMVAAGYAGLSHPWVEALVPPNLLAKILPEVARIMPGEPGDRIQVVIVATDLLPPMMAAPPGDLAAAVAVVPRGVPAARVTEALEAMHRVHELVLDAGGKRYLTGWLPDSSENAWRRQLGDERFESWQSTRARYDPGGTFTSALFAQLDGRS